MTLGKTIGDAFMHMYDLIRACQCQIQIKSMNMKPILVDQSIVDGIKAQANIVHSGLTGGQKAWPAMMRRVKRAFPDFDQ
jgi:ribulose-5-phosphate 4-epimerase/fuculose-1-phosphate aldolase